MSKECRPHAPALSTAASPSEPTLGVTRPTHADLPSPLSVLVDAAAQRLLTADPVAASKYKTGGPVDDPRREHQVLDSVALAAAAKNIDTGYVRDIFRDQIDATNAIQHARFAEWKLAPDSAPTTAPDLSAVRGIIDRLDQIMVNEIATRWDTLHSPTCGDDLNRAIAAVVTARKLDDLSRRALVYATHNYYR
jgi:chorismate mutase